MAETERISEAFDLIRQLAEQRGWIPIGWREFTVGDWKVTVNGTREARDGIQPYRARLENTRVIAFGSIDPYGGSFGGWGDAEDDFIKAMRTELESGGRDG